MGWCRWSGLGLVLAGVLGTGCNLLQFSPVERDRIERDASFNPPNRFSQRISQFVFFSDFEIQRNLPIFRELSNLREQIYKELHLPPSTAIIQVYLFEEREDYERFMNQKYPFLPKRRAFFVAQPHRLGGVEDLLVYTYWGDRVHQDLRHELTHALLHSVLKDVPLWLDEGLAEFFEVPPINKGTNFQHLEELRRGRRKPDLERLEKLSEVQQMTPAEYREAWAWVHLMLRGTPAAKKVLLTYLQELRTTSKPGPFQPRLAKIFLNPEVALARHLASPELTKSP